MIKNIIFDFDGTIADVLEPALDIINEMAREHGITETIEEKTIRELPLKKILKKLHISRWRLFFILRRAKKQMSMIMDQVVPFPEIPQVIQTLAKKHTLYIVSSNNKKIIIEFLKKHEMSAYFSQVVTSPFLFQKHRLLRRLIRKEHLQRKNCIYVGDEKRDVLAAKKAGVLSCAVTWGFNDIHVLSSAHPNIIVKKPQELLKVL